jgi:hypothetical protein
VEALGSGVGEETNLRGSTKRKDGKRSALKEKLKIPPLLALPGFSE